MFKKVKAKGTGGDAGCCSTKDVYTLILCHCVSHMKTWVKSKGEGGEMENIGNWREYGIPFSHIVKVLFFFFFNFELKKKKKEKLAFAQVSLSSKNRIFSNSVQEALSEIDCEKVQNQQGECAELQDNSNIFEKLEN